ncbi:hypothetical protein [Geminicoccus harenae]|uniref:hypothetical protein n=1 Tax=Geminicoccus harenae TaxID=2498453 RepID=UPI00168A5862|nr:hypothetical protein [Geminicoccus harenae]
MPAEVTYATAKIDRPAIRRRNGASDLIAALPFVADRTPEELRRDKTLSPRDFWSIKRTDDWALDFTLGMGLGDHYIEFMTKDPTSPLLGWIVKDMISKGHFGGVECGFLDRISRMAQRGAVDCTSPDVGQLQRLAHSHRGPS